MVHFITRKSINIFKFNLCAILTKIQPRTAFKIFIDIYSAPKSTDVTFQNLEVVNSDNWLTKQNSFWRSGQLADVSFSSFGVRNCEQATVKKEELLHACISRY